MSRILYNIRDINFHPVVIECADGVSFLVLLMGDIGQNTFKIMIDRLHGKV